MNIAVNKMIKETTKPVDRHLIKWRVSYLDGRYSAFCIIEAPSHKQAIAMLSKQPGVKILRVRSMKTKEQLDARKKVQIIKAEIEQVTVRITVQSTQLNQLILTKNDAQVPACFAVIRELKKHLQRLKNKLVTAQAHKKALAGSQLLPPKRIHNADASPSIA